MRGVASSEIAVGLELGRIQAAREKMSPTQRRNGFLGEAAGITSDVFSVTTQPVDGFDDQASCKIGRQDQQPFELVSPGIHDRVIDIVVDWQGDMDDDWHTEDDKKSWHATFFF